MFKLVMILIFIVGLSAGFVYLAPDTWKENIREWVNGQDYIPESVKEGSQKILGNPIAKRKELLNSIQNNLSELVTALQSDESSTEETRAPIALIEESRELLDELREELDKPISTPGTAVASLLGNVTSRDEVQCPTPAE
jgi:Skp family chaperone for outer membrane proteins